VKRLSIDEIAMHKGHKDFKTVVSNVDSAKLLEILDTHRSEEIIEMLMQQSTEVREAVEEVSIDMWGGFSKVVTFVFPNAVVVFDRFHVMKSVNEELNKIRKKAGVTEKHSKYLLLKNATDLNQEQKDKLEKILEHSICLKIAHELKEELRQIYETSQSVKSAQRSLNKWLQIAQVFYKKSTQTIRAHFDGICNYFISRTTSGVMEGINNRIKLIMRQGYGFTNFDNFRSRLLACFSN
jgi:transposase